jgi:predicted restriction endonuclease
MDEKMETEVMKELKAIRRDVLFIRRQVDPDTILTPEEERIVKESLEEHRQGKSIPLRVRAGAE